jgi:hypothetical protein
VEAARRPLEAIAAPLSVLRRRVDEAVEGAAALGGAHAGGMPPLAPQTTLPGVSTRGLPRSSREPLDAAPLDSDRPPPR